MYGTRSSPHFVPLHGRGIARRTKRDQADGRWQSSVRALRHVGRGPGTSPNTTWQTRSATTATDVAHGEHRCTAAAVGPPGADGWGGAVPEAGCGCGREVVGGRGSRLATGTGDWRRQRGWRGGERRGEERSRRAWMSSQCVLLRAVCCVLRAALDGSGRN